MATDNKAAIRRCCWNCTLQINGEVFAMPIGIKSVTIRYGDYRRRVKRWFGCFCSHPCALRYCYDTSLISSMQKKNMGCDMAAIRLMMYKPVFPQLKMKHCFVNSAPRKEVLQKFGGPMSEETYRHTVREIHNAPMKLSECVLSDSIVDEKLRNIEYKHRHVVIPCFSGSTKSTVSCVYYHNINIEHSIPKDDDFPKKKRRMYYRRYKPRDKGYTTRVSRPQSVRSNRSHQAGEQKMNCGAEGNRKPNTKEKVDTKRAAKNQQHVNRNDNSEANSDALICQIRKGNLKCMEKKEYQLNTGTTTMSSGQFHSLDSFLS